MPTHLSLQVELLHLLLTVAYPNECTWLRLLLCAALLLHILHLFLPPAAHQVHRWWRAEKPNVKKMHTSFNTSVKMSLSHTDMLKTVSKVLLYKPFFIAI